MNRLKRYWKELHLTYDLVNAVLGIILVVLLFLTFLNPEKRIFMMAAFVAGGAINIVNGLKIVKDKKKRSFGMSYIFFGVLIIFIGFILG